MLPIEAYLQIGTFAGHVISTEGINDNSKKIAQELIQTCLVAIRNDLAELSAAKQGIITQ